MDPETESTLDSVETTDQPTNLPTPAPAKYVTIRVTTSEDFSKIEPLLKDLEWYISYPHTGKNGTNPHYHIFVPGTDRKDAEKWRKRFKNYGYSGNKQLSVKLMENGLLQALQYGSKEGTTPITHGNSSDEWVASAPKWCHANLKENLNRQPNKRKRDESLDGMLKLTAHNVIYQAFKYRQKNELKSKELPDTILHMLDSQEFYLCIQWAKTGMPDFFIDVFRDSCEKGKITFSGTKKNWTNILFREVTSGKW